MLNPSHPTAAAQTGEPPSLGRTAPENNTSHTRGGQSVIMMDPQNVHGNDDDHASSDSSIAEKDYFDLTEIVNSTSRKFPIKFGILVTGLIWFISGAQITLTLFVTMEPPKFPICPNTLSNNFDIQKPQPPNIAQHPFQAKNDSFFNQISPTLRGLQVRPPQLSDQPPSGFDLKPNFNSPICNPDLPLPNNDCTSKYTYKHPSVSIVSEFDVQTVTCNSKPWRNVTWIHSALFAGILFGALFVAPLCDRIGRRPVLTIGTIILTVSALCSALSFNVYMYGICRFAVGLGSASSTIPSVVLLSEVVPTSRRQWIVGVQACAFAIAAAYISILSCLIPSWRLVTIFGILPAFYFLLGCVCCAGVYIESPKWLSAKGRMEESFHTWLHIAAVNKTELAENLDLERFTKLELEASHEVTLKSKADIDEELSLMSVQQLATPDKLSKALTTFPLSIWLCVSIWIWIVAAMVYYGILLDFSNVLQAFNISDAPTARQLADLTSTSLQVSNMSSNPAAGPNSGMMGSLAPIGNLGSIQNGTAVANSGPMGNSAVMLPPLGRNNMMNGRFDTDLQLHTDYINDTYNAIPGRMKDLEQALKSSGGRPEIMGNPFDAGRQAGDRNDNLDQRFQQENMSHPLPTNAGSRGNGVPGDTFGQKPWNTGENSILNPAAEYLKFVGGIVGNESKMLIDSARNLPDVANRFYNDYKVDQKWKSFVSDMSAQFQNTDPMAGYWRKLRLQSLVILGSFLAEIPAYLIAMNVASRSYWGRKKTTMMLYMLGGISLLLSVPVKYLKIGSEQDQARIILILALIGRSFIAAAFVLIYLYSAEIVPTSIRASSIGICSALARIGCVFAAPLANYLDHLRPGSAIIFFGVLCLTATFVTFTTLPETLDKPLYDTIETLEMAYEKEGFREKYYGHPMNRLFICLARNICCFGKKFRRCLGEVPDNDEPDSFEDRGRAWIRKRWAQPKGRSRSTRSSGRDSNYKGLFSNPGTKQTRRSKESKFVPLSDMNDENETQFSSLNNSGYGNKSVFSAF